jgi:hypothetical protein
MKPMSPLLLTVRMWLLIALIVIVLYIGPRRQPKTFNEVLKDV